MSGPWTHAKHFATVLLSFFPFFFMSFRFSFILGGKVRCSILNCSTKQTALKTIWLRSLKTVWL